MNPKMQKPAKPRSAIRNKRRGATAIEFAMMAPAFLVIIGVCAEFTRMSLMRNLAQNAAYQAARFVMTEGATVSDGIEVANEILGRVGTVDAEITINGNDGTDNNNDIEQSTEFITCRIRIPLKDNSLIIPESIIGDTEIEASMTVRTERYRGFFDAQTVGN